MANESKTLRIFHAPNTRGIRPIWLCEELGLPYEVVPVDFSAEYRASPEWRALNPVGKVPVLQDGDLTMMESGAMVDYILARYANGAFDLAPDHPEYAHLRQWMWFAEATLARPLGEIVNHGREFAGAARIDAVVTEMADRSVMSLEAVGEHLASRSYLVADTFTAADIMMGYSLLIGRLLVADRFPASLADYWERLSARPAFQVACEAGKGAPAAPLS